MRREDSRMVRMQGVELAKVDEFKYLGSTVQSNGKCGEEEKCRQGGVVEKGVRSDLRQKGSSKSDKQGLR
ncbi:hypothetical protein LDENG_00065310 [Lucifuga dentata]|nr:hypothetical protein LDENG_00065310 [Lucifuga dentata]